MNTPELPTHIGGYQHLEPDVVTTDGDILVANGKPCGFVTTLTGLTVERVESMSRCRVYRKYPCPRQGGERAFTPDEIKAQKQQAGVAQQLHAASLPSDAKARKGVPLASGLLDYFPDALSAVAELSRIGNDQHNPGKPLHWDRSKSGDEADALMRHLLQREEVDKDGVLHAVKVAWRGLALAQKKIEAIRNGR